MDKKEIENRLWVLIDKGADVYFAAIWIYDKDAFIEFNERMQKIATECAKKIKNPHHEYYHWYDSVCRILRVLDFKKLNEFENIYTNYTCAWIMDRTEYSFSEFEQGFRLQRYILSSITKNFNDPLFNLERDIHHEIYKSEMDIAKELEKQGNLRMAGAIASLVIEVHLKKIAIKHGIPIKEKTEISDYNNFLKRKGVYDGILADQIKSCKKTRNKCITTDKGDPSVGEVSTIIHIADRVINEIN